MSTISSVCFSSGATLIFIVFMSLLHYSSTQTSLSPVTSPDVLNTTSSSVLNTTSSSTCEAGNGDCPTFTPTQLSPSTDEQTTQSSERSSSVKPTVASTETKNKTVNTTTLKPDTSTPQSTTEAPQSSTKQPEREHEVPAETGICFCDLTAYYCDVDCCCDPDCSTADRRVFSQCISHRHSMYDDRYCYSHNIVFRNNTEHILQQTQNGIFCIVRSNLAASVVHPSQNVISSQDDFNRRWQRSHVVAWPNSLTPDMSPADLTQPYVAGKPVWMLKKSKVQSIELPSAGLTSACTGVKSVLFLEPWSGRCVNKSPANPSECESLGSHHYFNSLSVVQSPLLINQSELILNPMDHCMKNVCAPVNVYVCPEPKYPSKDILDCLKVSQPNLLFGLNTKTNVCHGVVKQLKYIFHHNGTKGIQYIDTYWWLTNITVASRNMAPVPIHQSFSVEFVWVKHNVTLNSTENNSMNMTAQKAPFDRSGRRGYIVGKPVPAGFRAKQIMEANTVKEKQKTEKNGREFVNLSSDKKDWLTLPQTLIDGSCDQSRNMRYPVTFGENVHLSCSVTLEPMNFSSSAACINLRRSIVGLLLGSSVDQLLNSSQVSDWGRVIAVFGDADTHEDNDWISLLLEEIPPSLLPQQQTTPTVPSVSTERSTPTQPSQSAQLAVAPTMHTCENIPLGMELRVMHALVGAVSYPQSKIIGASVRFKPVQDLSWDCSHAHCMRSADGSSLTIPIVSTVTFVDMSSPAVTRFAEPPAIHIRLPPDFFYPFISRESGAVSVYRSSIILCVTYLLITYLIEVEVRVM